MSALNAVWTALVGAIARGRITASYRGRRPLAQVQMLNGEIKDRVELITPYGMSANPAAGDAIVLTVGGSRDHVVVIAVDDSARRIRDLAPGEFGHSDGAQRIVFRNGHIEIATTGAVRVVADGNVDVLCGGTVTIKAPLTKIDGDLLVTGDITDVTGSHGTLAGLRTAYNDHVHTGVEPGGGTTGTTDTPI